jgi:hypothetical protein
MAPHLYRVMSLPGTNVLSSHLYWAESLPIQMLPFVPGGKEEAPTGTNALICTEVKKHTVQIKIGLGICWGSGPAHVRISGPLCGLEEFLVNTASTRGSEENNH